MRRAVLWRIAIRAGLVTWLGLAASARANVRLPPLFSDGAILQRAQPITVWGWADGGEKITVRFGETSAQTAADAGGRWRVQLPAQAASSVPRDLTVRGNDERIVHDVLVGDLWICSGQSNMEFTVNDSLDAKGEIARAAFPAIRQIKIGRKLAETPQEDFTAAPWRKAEPSQVGLFTAVGYYFARQVQAATGVPVGLINCTWSGTSVEPWMSAETLAANPAFAVVLTRWSADLAAYPDRRAAYEKTLAMWKSAEAAARLEGKAALEKFTMERRMPRPPTGAPDHPYPANPSAIYNGMVYPLHQAAVRGVLWYQGEANAVRAGEYADLFEASIRGWRQTFGQPELPFYWVQIANFEVDTDWARLREAQARALRLPATGQAVAIDIGDPSNIHPAYKQETGRRLAIVALAQLEHRELEFSGPTFQKAEFVGKKVTITFAHAAGLHSVSGGAMSLELAGTDRVFHPATGQIDGETLVVLSPQVSEPVAVRYAFSASPHANLYNLAGLPVAPFRSDAW